MFKQLVLTLTTEQIKALTAEGVSPMRVTDWRKGRRIPTRPQAVSLAKVTGCDWVALDAELAELEAPEEKRPAIRAAIAAALLVTASAGAQALPVVKAAADGGLYIMSTLGRRLLRLALSSRLMRFRLNPRDWVVCAA